MKAKDVVWVVECRKSRSDDWEYSTDWVTRIDAREDARRLRSWDYKTRIVPFRRSSERAA